MGRCRKSLKERVLRLAGLTDRNESDVLRDAVQEYLDRYLPK